MSATNPVDDVLGQSQHEIDGQIRESLRRGSALKLSAAIDNPVITQPGTKDLSVWLEDISGTSISDIDRLISELQQVRSILQSESDRVRSEIIRYSGLSQSAMATMRMVSDALQPRPVTPVPTRELA